MLSCPAPAPRTYSEPWSGTLKISRREKKFAAEIKYIEVGSPDKKKLLQALDENIALTSKRDDVGLPFHLALKFAREFIGEKPDDFVKLNFPRKPAVWPPYRGGLQPTVPAGYSQLVQYFVHPGL